MTYDVSELGSKISTGEELRYLRNYIDRNRQEMRLLSVAIAEIEAILDQQGYWFKNEIVLIKIKSLKKKLEEELTEKALKSIEIKEKYGEFLAFAEEAGEWE